jgi:5-hydroxyisourate hydrolase-like protein (transthyretin family)
VRFSAHVVDCAFGAAAAGLGVHLRRQYGGEWLDVIRSDTDGDGQLADWREQQFQTGAYQLEVNVGSYYSTLGMCPMYSRVLVEFLVNDPVAELDFALLITVSSFQIYGVPGTSAKPRQGSAANPLPEG